VPQIDGGDDFKIGRWRSDSADGDRRYREAARCDFAPVQPAYTRLIVLSASRVWEFFVMKSKLMIVVAGLAAATFLPAAPAAAQGQFSITIGSGGYGSPYGYSGYGRRYGYPYGNGLRRSYGSTYGYGSAYGYGSPYGSAYGYGSPYDYSYRHRRDHDDLNREHAEEHDDLDEMHAEAHDRGLSHRQHRRLHRYLDREHAYEHVQLQGEHAEEHEDEGY
jgi:hypothetical protein